MPRTKSIADLEQELAEKRKALQELEAKREQLASEMAKVDGQIAKLQGQQEEAETAAAPKRTTTKRRGSRKWSNLGDALADVLEGQDGVKVADAVQMVQDAGYKTTARTFRTIVNQTLASDPRFRRVSRRVYALDTGKNAEASEK